MRHTTLHLRPILLIFLTLVVGHTFAGDDPNTPDASLLREQVLVIPGEPAPPALLQVTLFTPPGPGPFPLAVMNHGATGDVPPSQQPRYRLTFSAWYFLSRGYAVALPMMRGYAGSAGMLVGTDCDDVGIGLEAARDIRAVIENLKQRPDIDGSRIIVAGQSFGGWNTLALGTLNVPGVRGLISFAGGMKPVSCADPADALTKAAAYYGKATTTPSIWFFGDNDQVFETSLWHAMYAAYTAAGGPAELVAYGAFGADSHQLLSARNGLRLWVPAVDSFLARVGLPNVETYPAYMPSHVPPPSHYADITDVEALPYLDGAGRAYYRKFLNTALPRAFAVGPNGAASAMGGFDPGAQSLKLCAEHGPGCRLYAVDNDVVWTRPTPVPPPTHFAALADVDAVPYLSSDSRAVYRQFLQMRRPRAFVVAPDGGADGASLGADPVAYALAHCSQLHQNCRLYAVDGDVVWSSGK
ncbi:CocE/NonD family hydrolase (plasmid) [Paraburkholderia sp. PREW-6R]|uniref:alpha/beta hydrolase family protein n=1 Tax=Paraburkholderia sp. PREW-6R TaxID=3141544 RepID=UPI0031F4A95C